jgi:hypothetical protein
MVKPPWRTETVRVAVVDARRVEDLIDRKVVDEWKCGGGGAQTEGGVSSSGELRHAVSASPIGTNASCHWGLACWNEFARAGSVLDCP